MVTDTIEPVRALGRAFMDSYPAEAARLLESAPVEEMCELLSEQIAPVAADILVRLAPEIAAQCVEKLGNSEVKRLLSVADPGRISSILKRLEPAVAEMKLNALAPSAVKELRTLMSYPSGTAGDMMDPRVASFRSDLTVEEVLADRESMLDLKP